MATKVHSSPFLHHIILHVFLLQLLRNLSLLPSQLPIVTKPSIGFCPLPLLCRHLLQDVFIRGGLSKVFKVLLQEFPLVLEAVQEDLSFKAFKIMVIIFTTLGTSTI